jgi:hypothetical protein
VLAHRAHRRQQIVAAQRAQPHVFERHQRGIARRLGQQSRLADDLAGAQRRERPLRRSVLLAYLDAPGLDHVAHVARIALAEDGRTRGERARLEPRSQLLQRLRLQAAEGARAAQQRSDERLLRRGLQAGARLGMALEQRLEVPPREASPAATAAPR